MADNIGGIIFSPADNAGRIAFAILSICGISGAITLSLKDLSMLTNGGTTVVAMLPIILETGWSTV